MCDVAVKKLLNLLYLCFGVTLFSKQLPNINQRDAYGFGASLAAPWVAHGRAHFGESPFSLIMPKLGQSSVSCT
jgi:hypothetical protein